MTSLHLAAQARRLEGGFLIGRASRFSSGCAITARKTNRFPICFHHGELDAGTRNISAWDDFVFPRSAPNALGVARASVLAGPRQ